MEAWTRQNRDGTANKTSVMVILLMGTDKLENVGTHTLALLKRICKLKKYQNSRSNYQCGNCYQLGQVAQLCKILVAYGIRGKTHTTKEHTC